MPDEKNTGSAVRIVMTITKDGKATDYFVKFLPSHPQVGSPAWRLTKLKDGRASSDVYDIVLTRHGPSCDCPDETYRGGKRPGCKHIRAMVAAGLLRQELVEEAEVETDVPF